MSNAERTGKRRLEELLFGLESDTEDERRSCVIWLAQLGTADVLPYLERMSADPAPGVRALARTLADDLRDRLELARERPFGFDPVALVAHRHPKARVAAALMCAERPSAPVRAALVAQLARETDPFVIPALVKALRGYADAEVIELVSDHLMDPDARVRASAVEALLAYEHPALARRVQALLHDRDGRVRGAVLAYVHRRQPARTARLLDEVAALPPGRRYRSAAHARRLLGMPVPPPRLSQAGQVVAEELESPAAVARLGAIAAAEKLAPEERAHLLRARLELERHAQVLPALMLAVARPGDACCELSHLDRHLRAADARVRAAAVEAIGRVGGMAALRLLEPAREDPAARVRSLAVVATERLARGEVRAALRLLVDAASAEELARAALALHRLERADVEAVHAVVGQARAEDRARIALLAAGACLHGEAARQLARLSVAQAHAPDARAGTPAPVDPLVRLGSETVQQVETTKLAPDGYASWLADLTAAEEALLRGARVPENLHLRRLALTAIARRVIDAPPRLDALSPALLARIEEAREAIGTAPSGRAAATPSHPQLGDGGFPRLGGRSAAGWPTLRRSRAWRAGAAAVLVFACAVLWLSFRTPDAMGHRAPAVRGGFTTPGRLTSSASPCPR